MLGKTLDVLVEDSKEGENRQLAGFTGNYLRVLLDCSNSAINRILPVKLLALDGDFIQGEVL
jgi:tRNA A37 methylthiotransferase MiaB